MMDTKELLTVEEVATLKGVHSTAVYKAISAGRLPSERLFGRVLIKRTDAEAFEFSTHGGSRGGGRPRKEAKTA